MLYRNGFSGILIEPNKELTDLSRLIRPKDKIINIGIGLNRGILPFYASNASVGSTFDIDYLQERRGLLHYIIYVPVMKFDDFFSLLNGKRIGLLSVDVEGWNLDVLKSALKILSDVYIYLVYVEYDTESHRETIVLFMRSINYNLI